MYLIQRRADQPVVGFFPNIVKYKQDGIPNCEIVTLNCASVDFQVTFFFFSMSSVLLKLPIVLIREDKKVSSLVDAFSPRAIFLFFARLCPNRVRTRNFTRTILCGSGSIVSSHAAVKEEL